MSQYYSCTIIRSTKQHDGDKVNRVSEQVTLEYENIEDIMAMLYLEYRNSLCEIIDCNISNAKVGGCVLGTFIVRYKEFDYSAITHEHFITVRRIESTVVENMAKKFKEYRENYYEQ